MGDEMIEKMKTITFQGNKYEVPEWVKWAAMDIDGTVCGYENKPYRDDEMFHPGEGQFICIRYGHMPWMYSTVSV